MDSKLLIAAPDPLFLSPLNDAVIRLHISSFHFRLSSSPKTPLSTRSRRFHGGPRGVLRRCSTAYMANSTPSKGGEYAVGDFMTRQENLQVVRPSTAVDEALETLAENRITGIPVIDDDWTLVGLVSDYDLLALDTISGSGLAEASMFPEVDSTWKVFNELQKLLGKTNGKLVADVMTRAPVVVHETTNLEDAARLLLETRHHRLPVVDADGKLVGIITRGDVIRAALQIKRAVEKEAQ